MRCCGLVADYLRLLGAPIVWGLMHSYVIRGCFGVGDWWRFGCRAGWGQTHSFMASMPRGALGVVVQWCWASLSWKPHVVLGFIVVETPRGAGFHCRGNPTWCWASLSRTPHVKWRPTRSGAVWWWWCGGGVVVVWWWCGGGVVEGEVLCFTVLGCGGASCLGSASGSLRHSGRGPR